MVLGYTPYFVLGYYIKNAKISKRLERIFAKCRIDPVRSIPFRKTIFFLSNISFGVYLVHVLVLDKVIKYTPVLSLPVPFVIPSMAVLTFAGAVVISVVINKIPYVRKIV